MIDICIGAPPDEVTTLLRAHAAFTNCEKQALKHSNLKNTAVNRTIAI